MGHLKSQIWTDNMDSFSLFYGNPKLQLSFAVADRWGEWRPSNQQTFKTLKWRPEKNSTQIKHWTWSFCLDKSCLLCPVNSSSPLLIHSGTKVLSASKCHCTRPATLAKIHCFLNLRTYFQVQGSKDWGVNGNNRMAGRETEYWQIAW